ncbi:MAG: hypothetical protein JO362_22740 [Streptomycetaceae bacterium]|nr:hypothetical protein [Streptomycetaceae bacterium]
MTEVLNQRAFAPYIVSWSGERPDTSTIVATRRGTIGYLNELPYDRDSFGALWARRPLRQGRGNPEWAAIHPQRQRRCMGGLLCQVCAKPADESDEGVLWLLDAGGGDRVAEGERTVHPPVCRWCVGRAVRQCPALREGHLLVRVKRPSVDGVHGTLYRPGTALPVAAGKGYVPYTDAIGIGWVLAGQLFATLRGCTPVQGSELAALWEAR